MIHDGSTDILAVNGLLLSYTWHTLHHMQHSYRDVSADVPDMLRVTGKTVREKIQTETFWIHLIKEVNQSTEMFKKNK